MATTAQDPTPPAATPEDRGGTGDSPASPSTAGPAGPADAPPDATGDGAAPAAAPSTAEPAPATASDPARTAPRPMPKLRAKGTGRPAKAPAPIPSAPRPGAHAGPVAPPAQGAPAPGGPPVATPAAAGPARAKGQKKPGWSPGDPLSAAARISENLLVRLRKERTTTAERVIRAIERGPRGPLTVAAFDFDGTLVGGLTGAMVLQERIRRKEVKLAELAETAGVTFKSLVRLLEANAIVSHSFAQWAGKTEAEMEELGEHLYENKIQDCVFPEMRRILEAHRKAGHTIVVATSASRFQVGPTVEALGIDHLLCTRIEVAGGKLTGKLLEPSMWGSGKAAAIKRFVAEHKTTLADTHFYADGAEEVGLMEAVGHPQPVNPHGKLTQAARANNWPVLRLDSRRGARPGNIVRGVAGLLSIVPILQAGLAVALLTRDKRAVSNMVMPAWIKTQLELAGVKLRVTGRHNLHARRPAVFIFNHRNNFDGAFAAALVRTDYVAVAKKEMGENPVGKLVAMLMPTVFIDRGRGSAAAAAAALLPVVEAVDQGYSILLAPEGTRTRGHPDSVGPFKSGAFHMAMAAGIPVVPIVIRNALDVAARDGSLRSGTVDIAVLPPVSVADWNRAHLKRHVAGVRQSFIDTLEAWPDMDEDD